MVAPVDHQSGQMEVCTHAGRSNHIRSHVMLFDSMPDAAGAVAAALGRQRAATLLVRFVGPFTSAEIAQRLAFDVRRATIDGLLAFFRANNSLAAYKTPLDDAPLRFELLYVANMARRVSCGRVQVRAHIANDDDDDCAPSTELRVVHYRRRCGAHVTICSKLPELVFRVHLVNNAADVCALPGLPRNVLAFSPCAKRCRSPLTAGGSCCFA